MISGIIEEFSDLEVYLAGGSVRDVILDRQSQIKDVDLFVAGKSIENALRRLDDSGHLTQNPHGTPRWYPQIGTDEHFDFIPIQQFNNGLWKCENIVDVLNHFDFTGNALAFNLYSGQFHNPQNGLRDLTLRVIRSIRFDIPDEPFVPGQTLSRRALLWFRLIHYNAVLGFTIEPITYRWLMQNRGYINQAELYGSIFQPLHPKALERVRSGL